MSKKLTIIIPVFNEAENLERVKVEFLNYFKVAKVPSTVLFVNDGSTDNSQSIIEDICINNQNFNYVQLDKNHGLSTALKAGFDTVNTELTGYIDADLQTHPEDFNLLLDYANEYKCVTGIRKNRNDSIVKSLSSKVANFTRRLFTHDGMTDTGCPLKIMHTENVKLIPMFRGLHRFLPAMFLLQNEKTKEVPVRHFKRLHGKSKFGILNRSFGPLIDCFAYLWMRKRHISYTVKSSHLSE